MAGNFWQSSHFTQWILDKQDLYLSRKSDLLHLSEDEYIIQALGEALKLRQQVIATATIYFKRFYARTSFRCIDPFLMSPTCIFVASKTEELGPIVTAKLMNSVTTVLKTKIPYAYKTEYAYRFNHILECEFFLLEMMDCSLIVYHPYRPLTEFCEKLSSDEQLLSLSWRIVNDSLRTDAALIYAPYIIALAALHMSSVILQKNLQDWFAEIYVDFDKVLEVTQMVLALYNLWKEGYDEKKDIPGILEKMPKPRINSNS